MDRIDCLRAFVRTLEGGSFSVAAKELGIGQPAVSKRIALLESEFGTQLFFRTTRKLKPTPEAPSHLRSGPPDSRQFRSWRGRTSRKASLRPTGTLRVSLPSSFGRRYLMPSSPNMSGPIRRFVSTSASASGSSIWWRRGSSWRCGSGSSSRARWSRGGSARCGAIWSRRRPICTAARCRATPEDLNAHQCIVYSRRARRQ